MKVDETTFSIQCGFHKKLGVIFNSIEGKTYDNNQKTYTFPIKYKDDLIMALMDLNVSIEEVLSFVPKEVKPEVALYMENDDSLDIFTPYSVAVSSFIIIY